MKTKDGKNWYSKDLDCYTNEFLKEIILDQQNKLERIYSNSFFKELSILTFKGCGSNNVRDVIKTLEEIRGKLKEYLKQDGSEQ